MTNNIAKETEITKTVRKPRGSNRPKAIVYAEKAELARAEAMKLRERAEAKDAAAVQFEEALKLYAAERVDTIRERKLKIQAMMDALDLEEQLIK